MSLSVTVQQFSGGVSLYDDNEAIGVSNYLYWLCGKFALEAQYITNGIGGGVVIPVSPIIPTPPVVTPNPLDFEITSSSFMVDGQSSVSIPTFIGYNLLFVRNNIAQSTVNLGNSYYNWDKVTGVFTCFPAATTSELFQLYPFV